MIAVKAVYKDGKLELSEPAPETGPVEVLVVFPEANHDDPWQAILDDTTPRPAFDKFVEEALKEIAEGKAEPLNLDDL